MNRRSFLRSIIGISVVAPIAVREWPFRVYFIPPPVKLMPIALQLEKIREKIPAIYGRQWLVWNGFDWILNPVLADERSRMRSFMKSQGLTYPSPVVIE